MTEWLSMAQQLLANTVEHAQRNVFILYSEYVVFRGLENVDGEKKKDKMFKNHPRAYLA